MIPASGNNSNYYKFSPSASKDNKNLLFCQTENGSYLQGALLSRDLGSITKVGEGTWIEGFLK